MSVLGLMENTADIAQTTPDLSALPSTNTERMGAAWDAAQTADRFWNVETARARRADKIIDDLHAMTGERLLNPYGIGNPPTADEARENVGQPMSVIYAKRLAKLRVATRNAKAGIEQLGGLPDDYLDVDSIDADIASKSGAARARDERMSGTGGGAGGFIGAMAGETVSPAGIATVFIPVTGGIGTTVARATIGAFAKNLAKEALFQGGTQALATGLQTMVDYQTRKQFGTEQTTEQIIDEIISAGAGGALLGGAFRAAHLGILKLASRGVEIPPAVLDNARRLEEGDLYGNKNPLHINPGQMERATDQATSAAALGRAASPEFDVPALRPAAEAQAVAGAAPAPAAEALTPEMRHKQAAAVEMAERAGLTEDIRTRLGKGETPEQISESLGGRLTEDEIAAVRQSLAQAAPAPAAAGDLPQMSQWQIDNAAAAVDLAKKLGLTEDVRRLAEQGDLTAKQISEQLGGRLSPEEVRAVRDSLGIAPIGPAQAFGVEIPGEGAKAAAPVEGARTREVVGNEIIAREDELKAKHGSDYVGYRLEANDDARLAALNAEYNSLPPILRPTEAVDPELQRLVKSIEDTPDNPMQAPRPAPPEPKVQPTTPKAPGESAEDKAVLQQAQQVLDSKTAAVVDPNLRRTMELAEIEESQAQAAVACLAGAI